MAGRPNFHVPSGVYATLLVQEQDRNPAQRQLQSKITYYMSKSVENTGTHLVEDVALVPLNVDDTTDEDYRLDQY